MKLFSKKSPRHEDPELSALDAETEALEQELAEREELRREIERRSKQDEEARFSTMPPPDELEDRRRERRFQEKLSRNELRNERRYQAKNGVMVFLLILAAVALAAWAWKIANSGI